MKISYYIGVIVNRPIVILRNYHIVVQIFIDRVKKLSINPMILCYINNIHESVIRL